MNLFISQLPRHKSRFFLLATLLLLGCGLAPAAASVAPADVRGGVATCVDTYLARLKPTPLDIDTIQRFAEACNMIERMQHSADISGTSTAVLNNQRFNTNVLLWMVVIITCAGVVLAGVQLYWSYQLALIGKGEMPGASETTVSKDSLIVKSSVVGVVILGFSLIFFVVFVLYVYPITMARSDSGAPADPLNIGTAGPVADKSTSAAADSRGEAEPVADAADKPAPQE